MENIILKQYLHKSDKEDVLFSINPISGNLMIETKKESIEISNNAAKYLISELQNELQNHGTDGVIRKYFWNRLF